VRLPPFQRSVEVLTKLKPFTVRIKAVLPTAALDGDNEVNTGIAADARMVSLSGADTPALLLTSPVYDAVIGYVPSSKLEAV
jgi:hypothetical protein